MKTTYKKLGMALAAAVACAGFISASAPTAQAQIVLTAASPVGTTGSAAGTYDYTYYVTFGTSGTTLLGAGSTNQAFVSLDLGGTSANLVSTPTFTISNSGIAGSFGTAADTTTDGGTYQWMYTGGTYVSSGTEALGYITVVSSDAGTVNSPTLNYMSQAADNVTITNPNGQTDLVQKQVNVPSDAIPAGGGPAAPLPAAFWPALLTLAGMAVVGGLKFRRNTL